MTTPLHSTLKRALSIDGRDYVVTLTETSLKLTLKGKRNGVELSWAQLVNGEAALAVALHASLGAFARQDKATGESPPAATPTPKPTRKPQAKPQAKLQPKSKATPRPARKK